MGLHKEIVTEYGITVSHWTIQDFSVDRENRMALITIVPYMSKAVMVAGAAPVRVAKRTIKVADVIYPDISGYTAQNRSDYTDYFSPAALNGKTIYEVMYEYIKTHIPEFDGATDE